MKSLNLRIKVFIFSALGIFFMLVPFRCFPLSMSEAEARVAREKLIATAKPLVGAPYVRGAVGPDSFDCSGFVYYVSREAISFQLPRTVKAMYGYVNIISDAKREPGDLVFFKTVGDATISHVGLYVGNGQFISAVSDGPNTGVILSSLKENYWKRAYAATGKFLRDSGWYEGKNENISGSVSYVQENGMNSVSSGKKFADSLYLDANLTGDWSVFTSKRFMPNFRGLYSGADLVYRGAYLSPGLGLGLRWNFGVKSFQMPLVFSLSFGEYFRAYAGPIFTFGGCYLPDSDEKINPSIFPGIIGFSFQTPAIVNKKNFKLKFVQDINYTVYNNTDGAALSPLKSFASGLEFSSGFKVTFPMSVFYGR